jgi:hypothetical protein
MADDPGALPRMMPAGIWTPRGAPVVRRAPKPAVSLEDFRQTVRSIDGVIVRLTQEVEAELTSLRRDMAQIMLDVMAVCRVAAAAPGWAERFEAAKRDLVAQMEAEAGAPAAERQ